jgi:hypothetical protein
VRGIPLLFAVLVLAAPAHAGGPDLRVGAAEDVVKQSTLVGAKAQMLLLKLAGFDTVRITVVWAPGETAPSETEAEQIRNVVSAAGLHGVTVVAAVYHFGSRTTPLTDDARAEFAQFAAAIASTNPSIRDFVIGNEPNLNRFWLPQFAEDGTSVAPTAYLQLLAAAYDALKAVSPGVFVWGGSLSPRGTDRPFGIRPTHSPTTFLRELGAAYRVSGRALPAMDGLAIHPYGDDSSQAPSRSGHPNTTTIGVADYGKLVGLLTEAFDGTAQPGSTLPILYDEYGVETVVPGEKSSLYTGTEPATIKPVDEATQGAFYREAVQMAFCQPNVLGILLFHTLDEPDLDRWQSGVYYADGTPKASLADVQRAATESRRGVVARCPGLSLKPRLLKVIWPRGAKSSRPVKLRLLCSLDCAGTIRVERLPGAKAVRTVRVSQIARVVARHGVGRLPPGRYRLRLTLRAPVNPGPPLVKRSPVLTIR